MTQLDDEQSKEAWKSLNTIIAALTKRAKDRSLSRARFENAYEYIFRRRPNANIKHEQESAYLTLFRISHLYLDDPPRRPLRSYDHIERAITALRHLGYSVGNLPDDDDPRTWLKHLGELLDLIQKHPPDEVGYDGELSGDVKAILNTLDLRGRAAIVGSRKLRNELADEIVTRSRSDPAWNVAESNVGKRLEQPLSAAISPQPHNYVSIWIEIFCQLIQFHRKGNDKAWLSLNETIRRFVEDWRWTGPGKDPLHFDERSFVNLVEQGWKSGRPWREFCAALQSKRSGIQNPTLVSAIAQIVRIGAAKALVVLRDVHDLEPVKRTVEALFGSLEPSKVWVTFRLLVTSEQPGCIGFLETETDKITHQVADPQDRDHPRHLHRPEGSITKQGFVDQLVLADPRAEGRQLRATARFADSLVAKFEKDVFLERTDDQEFLSHFLASDTSDEVTQQFRWALITGPAGAGKTRLAIQFLNRAQKQKFGVGFLELTDLKKFDARNWRPNWPTFIVIDYAAQSPNVVAEMLRGFVTTACEAGFGYPVRVLLLEREATGDWFKTIAPMDSNGAVLRGFCFRKDKERWDYPLTPLSSNALALLSHLAESVSRI
jgi:hypothetical protein